MSKKSQNVMDKRDIKYETATRGQNIIRKAKSPSS